MAPVRPLESAVGESLAAAALPRGAPAAGATEGSRGPAARIRALFERHYDFVWRSLRRLGLPADLADDGAQEVFLVAARRIDDIMHGAEKSFLYGTALRVASDARRARSRRPEDPPADGALEAVDEGADLEELTDRRRAREILDQVLDAMPLEIRAVFALYELEGMTMAEIAATLEIPAGTAASRLRRGRELFTQAVDRLKARAAREETR